MYGNTKSNRDMRDLSLPLSLPFLSSEAKRAGKERQPGNTDTHTIELGPSWGQGRGEGLNYACLLVFAVMTLTWVLAKTRTISRTREKIYKV